MLYRVYSDYSKNICLSRGIPQIKKLFGPRGWKSHLVFSVCQNTKTVDSNTTSKELHFPDKKKQELPSSMSFF